MRLTKAQEALLALVAKEAQALRDFAGQDPGAALSSHSPECQALEMAEDLETSAAAVLAEASQEEANTVTVSLTFPPDLIQYVVKDLMWAFPEASSGCALMCTRYFYPEGAPMERWRLEFEDTETGKIHTTRARDWEGAFLLLFSDKWPKGCTQPPVSTNQDDWDNWASKCDATDHDAYAQLVCLGEVIYG